jgi:hypothetical protein
MFNTDNKLVNIKNEFRLTIFILSNLLPSILAVEEETALLPGISCLLRGNEGLTLRG